MGAALGQMGDNYAAPQAAAPQIWKGRAAEAATAELSDFAEGFATRSEAAQRVEELREHDPEFMREHERALEHQSTVRRGLTR